MALTPQTAPASRKMFWAGIIMSAIPVLVILMSATAKLAQPDVVKKGFDEMGWDHHILVPLGLVELTCTAVYLIPRSSILGAILLTGYLGGATAAHVRAGQQLESLTPIILGVLVWGGLYLRCSRLRALLPLRS
jgi:hypothetical protein